jgi:hypothetical protein
MPPRQRLVLVLLVPLTAAALALLSGLASRPSAQTPGDLRLGPSFYLSPAAAQWLALAALAPLGIALVFAWRHEQPVLAYLQPELLGAYGWWIAFANGYAASYMISLSGILPRFEPALRSLDDPRLRQVPLNLLAAAVIAGVVAFFVWFIFGRARGFGSTADRISLPHRRAALLLLLTAVCASVWLFGGLTYALVIIPASWLWILIEPRRDWAGRAANVGLALAGLAPFVAAYFLLADGLSVWHLVLAAGYIVLLPFDALAFLLIVALFVRFLRLGLSASYLDPGAAVPGGA